MRTPRMSYKPPPPSMQATAQWCEFVQSGSNG
jgi:hypothetical protein